MFEKDQDRAVAYAAMKTLERFLKSNGDFSPGFTQDVSGCKITITLPPGSVVSRDIGPNGDGTILKTAVQNLYGYALWALMIARLRKFKQWDVIRSTIIETMQEVINRSNKNLREEISKEFPDIEEEIELIQKQLKIPQRKEETPRVFKSKEMPATVKIEYN